MTMKAKIDTHKQTGDNAEFLRRHGEDEIGMRIGQNALDRAFARPFAEPAAGMKTVDRGIDLESVDDAMRRARIDEFDDAGAHMRHEFIGEQHAADADAADAGDPEPMQPAMKNSAAQTSDRSMVWPKSGCRISGTIVNGRSSTARRLPGTSARLPPSAKAQAARTTKAGFINSDG